MKNSHKGIHHISVLGGDGQRTTDFYVKILGLRMIMKTVNQDDPSNYHLFYVNGTKQPGSSITFFPWPMAVQGKPGSGEATVISFSVPEGSEEYWAERFGVMGVDFEGPFNRFGRNVMRFKDPDHLTLELVFESEMDKVPAWDKGAVPAEYGIRGFWGTNLSIEETEDTAELLEEVFGFEKRGEDGNTSLYQSGADIGNAVILEKTDFKRGTNGRGIVHHVAFRAKDDEEQEWMRKEVMKRGLRPTEQIDRHFFRSVYFLSPGGVLFEIATDGPGYDSVQDEEDLGKELYLPEILENRRQMIENRLPEIKL